MVRSLDESKFISALANPAGVCCVVSQKSNVDFVASLKTATVQTEGLTPLTTGERWLLEAFCSANSQLDNSSTLWASSPEIKQGD